MGVVELLDLQPPGRVTREMGLADVPLMSDYVCCAQLGDAMVLDYHSRDVRAAKPEECLPMAVRLAEP